MKPGIDQDALITMFAEASAKQGEAVRKAVSAATLRALQGRELTLDNIRKVVKNVAESASLGIARNAAPQVDVTGLIDQALAGIDAALLRADEVAWLNGYHAMVAERLAPRLDGAALAWLRLRTAPI